MKNFFTLLFAGLLACVLAVPLAQAQITPRAVTTLTLTGTTTVGTAATNVITSQAFLLKPGSGFAVVPTFVLSGADTANVTFNFAVSIDGTTWSTTTPFTYAEAATGATPVIGFKNFAAPITGAGADNILYVRLASVANASSTRTCTVSSVIITRNN